MALLRIETHAPCIAPLLESIQVGLEVLLIAFRFNGMIHEAVVSEESNLRRNDGGQVINMQEEQERAEHSTLGDSRVHGYCAWPLALNHHTLISRFEKDRNPLKDVTLDAIELEFLQQPVMWDRVKCFWEIEYRKVHLDLMISISYKIMNRDEQLALTGMTCAEAMV